MGSSLADALEYLDSHVNFETAPLRRAAPTLDRMRALCHLLGDPQDAFAVVHLSGTNGKGSTARMLSALLGVHGLSVGTYTSPHLQRINERMAWDGEAIDDESLASLLGGLEAYESHLGVRLTHFELLTAAAFRWFADNAVEVVVLEVGMGGRWDATNVATGSVAVITNVGLDHAEIIGPTRVEIAVEKSGIVKPGSVLVLGETDPALVPIFSSRGAAAVWHRNVEFGCLRNSVAVGGRVLDLMLPSGELTDVFVPLRGEHQGDNAACAVAAAEAFFGRGLDATVVSSALAEVTVPGRFEIVGRHPLVVLDGAHNPDGARALAKTLEDDLAGRWPDVLVVGFTVGRDPGEMLSILGATRSRLVIACRPPSPRGLPVADVVAAAHGLGIEAVGAPSVGAAVRQAVEAARMGDFVLVTCSLYVVGDARTVLAVG